MANILSQMTGELPPKSALLPPNSPDRKDWGILSDSLGLPEHYVPDPNLTPLEGALQMRLLLLKCVANPEAYEALIMKCASRSIESAAEQGANRDEILSFLKSRLWNRRSDGAKTKSVLGREFSSNDIIQAWDPSAGGIVAYLRANSSNIMARDWVQYRMEVSDPKRISLTRLGEMGVELDTKGQIVRRSNSGGSEDEAPDLTEHEDALDTEQSRLGKAKQSEPDPEELETNEAQELAREEARIEEERALGAALEEKKLVVRPEEWTPPKLDSAPGATPELQAFDVAYLGSAACVPNDLTLVTANHPDFELLSAALQQPSVEPELDLKSRKKQLRDLAETVIREHMSDSPDLDDLLDGVNEWDPFRLTFSRYYPDLIPSIRSNLDQVQTPVVKREVNLELAQMEDISACNEILAYLCEPKNKPRYMPDRRWKELRSSSVNWLSDEATSQDDLLTPERKDWIALNLLHGKDPDMAIAPEEMSKQLKTLADSWLSRAFAESPWTSPTAAKEFCKNHRTLVEMKERIKTWEPLEHGMLGEQMILHLREIRSEQLAAENEQIAALSKQDRLEIEKAIEAEAKVAATVKDQRSRLRSKAPLPDLQGDFLADIQPSAVADPLPKDGLPREHCPGDVRPPSRPTVAPKEQQQTGNLEFN